MSLSTFQLAGTSVLALLAGSTDAPGDAPRGHVTAFAAPVVAGDDLGSRRLALDLSWKTKRTASDVLTDLLDVDGVRVVAARHTWDRPDTLALRHEFASDMPVHLYFAAGIDRVVYLDSRALSSSSTPLGARRQRSMDMMAEVGASWRLTRGLDLESDIHWMDLSGDARLVRTDAGWVSGDTAVMSLSLVWRGR